MTREEFVEYIEKLGWKNVDLEISGANYYAHPEMPTEPICVRVKNVQRLKKFDNGTIVHIEAFPFRESNVFVPEDSLRKSLENLHVRIKRANGPIILDPTDLDNLDEFFTSFLYD